MTNETNKWTNKGQRIADNIAAGLPANEREALRAIRSPLLKLRAAIHNEIAPIIAANRRWDAFIHSSHSTFQDFLKTEMELTSGERQTGERPALPIGLPMPSNLCIAPRINL